MSVEQRAGECFGQVVRHIDGCVYTFQVNVIALNPFTQIKVLNINMSSSTRGFLCISHCCASIIVFVSNCRCLLWYVQIP
jgi:hypothetical protein